MTSRNQPSVRQPVSCENCRRRKIKCSRTRPPCDTCRRRGFADTCTYKTSSLEVQSSPSGASALNEELLNRISNLESLLRHHTSSQAPDTASNTAPMLSPPTENAFQPSPVPFLPDNTSPQTFYSESQTPHTVGYLNHSPTGNVRYELKASQWNSVLANTNLSIGTPAISDGDEDVSSSFPFTTGPAPSLDELLAILPPTQQCDYLKDRYFAVFSPLFHILHDPTFHEQYSQFVESPSSTPLSWLAALFIVLALAVTALEDNDPVLKDLVRGQDFCSNMRSLSKRYRDAAMKCLAKQGVFWGRHNVQSLQALILLAYAMGHSQEPTWVLLGMIQNVAIALACHVDPSRFNLNPIQSEERKRCWAGLTMLYTIQSIFQGNPDPSWGIKYNLQLPADVNDCDISIHGIEEHFSGPTQMSYLLLKFKLYDLASKICKDTFSEAEPSRAVIQKLDHEICLAQESWDARYLSDTTFEALPVHHAVHLHILHAYSHQLFLLLHRPLFSKSVLGFDIPNESQIRCIASAEALLDIHRLLSETASFRPYMWYTNGLGSFHAFHAAVVLAVALLMPIYKPQYRRFRSILDEALARFETSAGRSKICERSAKILRFLLSTPSPNQTSSMSILIAAAENSNPQIEVANDQMSFFADRLQPQQWLGPSNMAWTEWDTLMSQMEGVRT